MLKIENVVLPSPEQWGSIIRGMRNPKNSWNRMDSFVCDESVMSNAEIEATCGVCLNHDDCPIYDEEPHYIIGPNDHKLMMSLAKGGPVHAKYRRMITVYLDITAPLYWWKEFDTYKVGTVANSCSTMHKITDKEFVLDDFSHEHLDTFGLNVLKDTISLMNYYRTKYLEAKTKPMKEESKRAEVMKQYWWQMIQLLPTSYNQKRTVMLTYEVLHNIRKWRRNHKLDEWHVVCDFIESLPYSEIITIEETEVEPAPIVMSSGAGPNGIVRTPEEIERDQKARENVGN